VLHLGEEADAFVAWLEAALLAIVNEHTGAPLVRRVRRTASLYAGEQLHTLPDLLIEWNDAQPTGTTALAGGAAASIRATSPEIGTLERANDYARTGEHRPGGWFVAAGRGITPGRLAEPVSLLDLAPTFTAMLGVRLDGCDGREIEALLGRDG
jgi:predicted AlkP superfamily phosphohydrolase/phosphomutase